RKQSATAEKFIFVWIVALECKDESFDHRSLFRPIETGVRILVSRLANARKFVRYRYERITIGDEQVEKPVAMPLQRRNILTGGEHRIAPDHIGPDIESKSPMLGNGLHIRSAVTAGSERQSEDTLFAGIDIANARIAGDHRHTRI